MYRDNLGVTPLPCNYVLYVLYSMVTPDLLPCHAANYFTAKRKHRTIMKRQGICVLSSLSACRPA